MYSNQDMHYIQKDIILSLAMHSPQRFSQLQPPHLPNNTFSYHLKRLLDGGYVTSSAEGYVATRKALKTLQYSSEQIKHLLTPTVITIIYVTNEQGQVLIQKRTKRPFVDYYGLPSGLVHTGETLHQAASRELQEKTGITATSPIVCAGVVDFQYLEQESQDIFVHAIAFVYTYRLKGKPPATIATSDTLSWSNLTEEKILPEVEKVHELVQGKPAIISTHFAEPS